MIFDTHVHLGRMVFTKTITKENLQLPAYQSILENTWEKYVKQAGKRSIHKAVVFPFVYKELDIERANRYVLEAHKHNMELFIPFLLNHSTLTPDELSDKSVYGIKEHFYIDKNNGSMAIYEYLENKDLCLLIHSHWNERVPKIKLIKRDFPKMKIIIAHSGRRWPFGGVDVLEFIVPELKHYEDVHFDTSTIRDSKVIEGLVSKIGSDRVLFGSDYPFNECGEDVYNQELMTIENADIAQGQKEQILYSNFKRLFLKDTWLRRVSKGDREHILHLFNNLPLQEKKFLAIEHKSEIINANIRDERHLYLIENNDVIIGLLRESGRNNGGAMIEELLVRKEYRGRGHAQKLLNLVINKFEYLELKTFHDNISMNRLCELTGFQIDKKSANGKILYWKKVNNHANNRG